MCTAAAAAGVAIAQAVAGYAAANQQAGDANRRYEQNRVEAVRAASDRYASLADRGIRDSEAASQETIKARIEGLQARATATVAAGENGGGGLSLNALLRDFMAQEGRALTGIQTNLASRQQAYLDEGQATWPRVRETFVTEAEARSHELASKALHAVGKPYQKPEVGTAATTKIATVKDLFNHCIKVRWSQLRSYKNGDQCSQIELAKTYVDWVGPAVSPATALTAAKIDAFVLDCMKAGNSGSTVNRKLTAISVMLKKAVAQELGCKPLELPWQPEGEGRKRYYTPDEERQILEMTHRMGREKLHAYFEVMVETAIRPKELRRLPWRDIHATMLRLDKKITKNGQERRLPLSPRARAAIERMRAEYGDEAGPFVQVREDECASLWRRLRTRLAWMDDTTVMYTFRHTCISRWANDRRLTLQGISQKQIAMWCGHTMRVHEGYVHQIIEADQFAGLVGAVYGGDNVQRSDGHADIRRAGRAELAVGSLVSAAEDEDAGSAALAA